MPTDVSARGRFFAGPIRGRTHRSAPTRGGRYSETREIGVKRTLPQRGGTEPAPYGSNRAGRSTAGCGHPALRVQHRWCPAKGRCGHRPLRKTERFRQPPGPAAHSGASAARMGGRGGNRSREHPQNVQQPRTIPQSRRSRASSLCTREPWGRGMRIAASLRSSQ